MPLSDHVEELIKLSIEERCGMVKHCRIDKTFQPQQCRVTLAVETLHLRYAVVKALEALQETESRDRDLERHWHENFKTGRESWKRIFWRRRERTRDRRNGKR